jgi:hypothetical protein
MSAQRLGSILTNITGTSGQILRVNTAETGFEFVSPPVMPVYTITNDTTDRIIDANNSNLDELSDVLSTLIKDVNTTYIGAGGISPFTWSTSEQTWPFEKGPSGETLYAKEISLGALPNSGEKDVAHGISNFNAGDDTFFLNVHMRVSSTVCRPLPYCLVDNSQLSGQIWVGIYSTYIFILDAVNYSSYTAVARIIYKKSG